MPTYVTNVNIVSDEFHMVMYADDTVYNIDQNSHGEYIVSVRETNWPECSAIIGEYFSARDAIVAAKRDTMWVQRPFYPHLWAHKDANALRSWRKEATWSNTLALKGNDGWGRLNWLRKMDLVRTVDGGRWKLKRYATEWTITETVLRDGSVYEVTVSQVDWLDDGHLHVGQIVDTIEEALAIVESDMIGENKEYNRDVLSAYDIATVKHGAGMRLYTDSKHVLEATEEAGDYIREVEADQEAQEAQEKEEDPIDMGVDAAISEIALTVSHIVRHRHDRAFQESTVTRTITRLLHNLCDNLEANGCEVIRDHFTGLPTGFRYKGKMAQVEKINTLADARFFLGDIPF